MLREITRKEYMYYFYKKDNNSKYNMKEFIDTSKYSNTYFALDKDAFIGIEYLKKGVIGINGLFSLEPSRGEELLNTLIKKFEEENKKALTLNCTKELKDKYYTKNWGFYNAWYLSSINYYELVLFL